jgi:tRNA A-37 threonylcarbamoyl transferase component Bud32
MIPLESTLANPSCPPDDELSAFLHGQLALDQLETIAEHLAGCATCANGVDAMQSRDQLLRQLRCAANGSKAAEESAWANLEERARGIPDQQAANTTMALETVDTVRESSPLPLAFGSYLLLEVLGEGGMGVVYKARQEKLKRFVALKMVRAGIYASSEERARFQREGEVIASLEHPHVVQIHEFGECDGQSYFSMELLQGGTLADKLGGRALPERAAAELVQTLAHTVEAAHRRGIVHRDLKPSNVLFAADGTAKISDFGLAKVLDGESSDTRSDAILGTPAYMAPEQARGEIRRLGPAADVYALGAILYETLTGRPPFRGESRYQTLEWVRTREPEPPRRSQPHLSRDLEAICLKCLEKEASRRYESAAALADDLQRWLDGQTTKARPLSWPRRLGRSVRRRPAAVAAVAFLLMLAALPAFFSRINDPQRKLDAIQARLRRGETVELLDKNGELAWYRWELGKGIVDTSPDEGALKVAALDAAMLTLVADPQGSYRFSAEIRHERSLRLSEVGLYFAHSKLNTSEGWQHCYAVFAFNDLEANFPHPNGGQKVSRAVCHLRRIPESGRGGSSHDNIVAYFPPARSLQPAPLPWRRLAVEARPTGFDLFWEKNPPLHLDRQNILSQFEKGKLKRDGMRTVPILPELRPDFSPHDALGLFVAYGRALFRNVRVEPLPNP